MSTNSYTEYIFTNPDYERAMARLQSILFNVAVKNQAVLEAISHYDFDHNSEEIRQQANLLYNQVVQCFKKIMNMTFDLSEFLKQLDSYSFVFEQLKSKSLAELAEAVKNKDNIDSMNAEAIQYVPEEENNILIDPNTQQPYWVDPKTGESYWYDTEVGKPYYVDPETNEVMYIDVDAQQADSVISQDAITEGAVQPDDVFGDASVDSDEYSETPEITDAEEIDNAPNTPVITSIEDADANIESSEPVITSSTTINTDVEESTEETSTDVKESAENSDEVVKEEPMYYDDAESTITDTTSAEGGAVEETKDSNSKDENKAAGVGEVQSTEGTNVGKSAENSDEVVKEEPMYYDDEESTITDTTSAEGGAVEETKDSNSNNENKAAVVGEVQSTEGASTDVKESAENSDEVVKEEPMYYDDAESTITDTTSAEDGAVEETKDSNSNNENKAAVVGEVQSTEGTSTNVEKSAENSDEVKEEPMYYDDAESTITDTTSAEDGAVEEAKDSNSNDKNKAAVIGEVQPSEETSTTVVEEDKKNESVSVIIPDEEKPIEVGSNNVIEIVPDETENGISMEEVTSAPLIPVVDEETDVNGIIPLIPKPTGLSNEPTDEDVLNKQNPTDNVIPFETKANVEDTKDENASVVEDNGVRDKYFRTSNNNPVRAILTSKKQISNLRKSQPTQEALLNARGFFGDTESKKMVNDIDDVISESEDLDTVLQTMLAKANQLYKDGKSSEAEEMYKKISEINKARQAAQESEVASDSEGYAYKLVA